MFDTYQHVDYLLRPSTAHCTESWFPYVAVIHVEKIVSSFNRALAQSPACRMDTMETSATKATDAAAPQ